jgi:hypothetical protein
MLIIVGVVGSKICDAGAVSDPRLSGGAHSSQGYNFKMPPPRSVELYKENASTQQGSTRDFSEVLDTL